MTIYAVGDIQGCFDALECVLDKVCFNPTKDQLWCAGDLVNRGPQSLKTLRFIKSLGDSAKVVLGNHDLHLLAIAFGGHNLKPKDNLQPILEAKDSEELLFWLKDQPLMLRAEGYTMVHAGICPNWNVEQAEQLANEVHQCLSQGDYAEYFAHMYGNQPDTWQDDLTGLDRLRTITNYFTRIRYCKENGQLNLNDKKAPDAYGDDFAFSPWYDFLNTKWQQEKIIMGHWASIQGNCPTDNVYALDTGCVWGGKLTLMRLDDNQLFQCECS